MAGTTLPASISVFRERFQPLLPHVEKERQPERDSDHQAPEDGSPQVLCVRAPALGEHERPEHHRRHDHVQAEESADPVGEELLNEQGGDRRRAPARMAGTASREERCRRCRGVGTGFSVSSTSPLSTGAHERSTRAGIRDPAAVHDEPTVDTDERDSFAVVQRVGIGRALANGRGIERGLPDQPTPDHRHHDPTRLLMR